MTYAELKAKAPKMKVAELVAYLSVFPKGQAFTELIRLLALPRIMDVVRHLSDRAVEIAVAKPELAERIAGERPLSAVEIAKALPELAAKIAWLDPGSTLAVDVALALPDRVGEIVAANPKEAASIARAMPSCAVQIAKIVPDQALNIAKAVPDQAQAIASALPLKVAGLLKEGGINKDEKDRLAVEFAAINEDLARVNAASSSPRLAIEIARRTPEAFRVTEIPPELISSDSKS